VSVIIPAFNEEKYVGRCIRSALSQSLRHSEYEIIVINDCSTDNTSKVLDQFRKKIKIFNNKKNIGLPGALNEGIKKASGQFIVRIDADDYVHPEYLNTLSLYLRMNNNIDAVACDYMLIDDRQNTVKHMDCMEYPIGCAIMYRIEQLIDIGLYDESFLAREDEDLRIRFNEKYKVTHIPIPLYKYHIHNENLTSNKEMMEEYRDLINKKHNYIE